MASHHHDALWEKLHELEAQLAAYKFVRAASEEDAAGALLLGCVDGAETPRAGACRGRQYEAYMRRRDARRVAASTSSEQHHHQQQQEEATKAQQPRLARRRPMALSPRALRCASRDTQEVVAGTPRLAVALAKRTPPALLSIPTTPRKDTTALARSRTVNSGGAVGSPARSHSSYHHQRRNSLGALAEFAGECATPTPRPFLKRGTGTGGAAAPARLRVTTRVHDLPAIDVASTTPRPAPQQQEVAYAQAQPRGHAQSVSELPAFDVAALASPQAQGRARKRWGSPERPAAMFSSATGAGAGDSYGRDLSKGLKKLLSFVRKGGRGGGGEQQQPFPVAASPRGSGKPVMSKGWSGCSLVDVPFDRASLEAHRFPMTRAVGISSG
ncbi:hypothetical protein HU200_059972 [Digitaria exilis]|uniref:Uncharacterized protein n=1 Tax=Digitaria exilis TaxID=1010633 RepID=A0A835DY13_9POAL|nr:hypothetical protein HU200_059972 [Digitaria exilis]